jgi:C4-dicarboxylate transporter DctM subunit
MCHYEEEWNLHSSSLVTFSILPGYSSSPSPLRFILIRSSMRAAALNGSGSIPKLFYLFLGTFLEGLSIMVMTLPITLPLVIAAGWNPIWFGVFLVITVELATVTPPVGFNLFVLQALTGEPLMRVA